MDEVRIDEDVRCGFCWERFGNMTDPRELSCKHVYCRTCLDDCYRDNDSVTCRRCQVFHQPLDIASLPKVTLNGTKTSTTTLKCDRVGCSDKLAISYCVTCYDKLCDTHLQRHQAYFGSEHDVETIHVYEAAPEKYQKVLCDTHSKELMKACSKCDKLVCMECDMSERDCSEESSQHKFNTLAALKEEITSYYKQLLGSMEDRITEICRLSKQTWGMLDDKEVQCKKWVEELELARDEQIRRVNDIFERVKDKISDYQKEVTDDIENFDANQMNKKDNLKELRTTIHKLTRDGHVTEKIKQKHELTVEVINNLDSALGTCQLTAKPELAVNEDSTSAYADFINLPTSLELSSEHDVGRRCYCACYRADGVILLGCEDGVWLLNRNDESLIKAELPFGAVCAVIEHHQCIYILHKEGDTDKVEICLPDLKQTQTLFIFENTGNMAAKMVVSDKYIVAYSAMPNENHRQRQLIIYDLITKRTKIMLHPHAPRGPCFLQDEHLFVTNRLELSKYSMENGEFTKVIWTCKQLHNIMHACPDSDGLIYGCTYKAQGCIYIISPQGKLLEELRHSELPATAGVTSVRGDEIAIPGWDTNKLHIFKFNYK